MDWQVIVWVVLVVLLALAGGYIKKLVKEMKEFFDVLHDAFADSKISDEELAKIIKEAKDVKEAVLAITKLAAKSRR